MQMPQPEQVKLNDIYFTIANSQVIRQEWVKTKNIRTTEQTMSKREKATYIQRNSQSPKKHKIKENLQEQRHSKEKDEKKVGSTQT